MRFRLQDFRGFFSHRDFQKPFHSPRRGSRAAMPSSSRVNRLSEAIASSSVFFFFNHSIIHSS